MARDAREWNTAISSRQKTLEKNWLDAARKVVDIYEGQADTPFNILYSNTETLLPTLYNSTPRPEVARRHTAPSGERKKDAALAVAAERFLEYAADSNDGEYETFDEVVSGCVIDALVPGAGVARAKLKQEGAYQHVCFEHFQYDRFLWGYAKKWTQVPWVAYGHDLNKTDFERFFPVFSKTQKYNGLNWKALEEQGQSEEDNFSSKETGDKRREPTVLVWEIWEPSSQSIFWVSDEFEEDFLKQEKYPFSLTSRVPSPAPLRFIKRVNKLIPVPLYQLYEEQAEELNRTTTRLLRVIKAIRVRGVYDGRLTEIEKLLDSDEDNQLVSVDQAAALENGGFDKAIWFMPIDKLVETALSLYDAREKAKQAIYEIMGIGDILRGASDPQETAKAQSIKNQWGGLRVKRMQKDVQTFCRQLFRIGFEFAANLFTPLSWKETTQLPYLFNMQRQQLQMAQAQFQAQMQEYQAAANGGVPPDQLPPPPQNPIPQELAFLVEFPTWEEIIETFQDRFERTYKIDVETNSTVDLEATEDKAQITEFMNAWGQMTAGLEPMIASGTLPFDAAKMIMLEVFKRFRFGRQVEMAIEMMTQPQPPPDEKAAEERHKAEMERVKAEAGKKVLEMQETVTEYTGEIERLKIENKALKEGMALEKVAADTTVKARENELKSDFATKVRTKEDQIHGREQKLQQDELQLRLEGIIQKHQLQMDKLQGQVEAMGRTPIPGGGGEGGEDAPRVDGLSMQRRHDEMMQALADSQKSFQNMISQLAVALAQPRRTDLVLDPKTQKPVASISRVVDPSKLN